MQCIVSSNYSQSIKINIGPSDGRTINSVAHCQTVLDCQIFGIQIPRIPILCPHCERLAMAGIVLLFYSWYLLSLSTELLQSPLCENPHSFRPRKSILETMKMLEAPSLVAFWSRLFFHTSFMHHQSSSVQYWASMDSEITNNIHLFFRGFWRIHFLKNMYLCKRTKFQNGYEISKEKYCFSKDYLGHDLFFYQKS